MKKVIYTCNFATALCCLCILLALFLAGCGSKEQQAQPPEETTSGVTESAPPENLSSVVERYENRELGFSVEFPGTWKDKYTVEANTSDESGTSIVINTTWGGTLCYVFRYTSEEWVESGEGESIPVEYRVLGESDHYIYLMLFPGDVQYDPGNEEQVDTYNEMRDDLYSVKFEIIGT